MDMFTNESSSHALEMLRSERARQDKELAQARLRLSAIGPAAVSVPRRVLEALDAACLVRVSPLDPTAIHG